MLQNDPTKGPVQGYDPLSEVDSDRTSLPTDNLSRKFRTIPAGYFYSSQAPPEQQFLAHE